MRLVARNCSATAKLGREARRVDEICRAAAVMMCGRGVPLDVVASVLHVPLLRVRKWTERR